MPCDIGASDVDGLIGREENQRLDFKERMGTWDDSNRELARDICSFANADGGYIVIGAKEDEEKRTCSRFCSVLDPQALCQRIRQVALDCLEERIAGLDIRPLASSQGDVVVAVYIPGSFQKPHMVTRDGKTEFWKRYQTDKRQMSMAEIRDAFLQTAGIATIHRVEARLDSLIAQREGQGDLERQRRLAEDRSRLNEITDIQTLWDAVDKIFEEEAKEKRYLRLTITPEEMRKDLVDPERKDIQKLLVDPPGQREHGWNAKSPDPFLSSDSLGLRSADEFLRYAFIRLMRNGHFEFWKKIDAAFCWGQGEGEFKKQPSLYPHAVTEYPVSFLGLSKALYEHLKVGCRFRWRMIYWNLRGCTLLPYHPNAVDYYGATTYGGTLVYKHSHFQRDAGLANDFDPDVEALRLIEELYLAFGYTRQCIPFFDDQGKFQLK